MKNVIVERVIRDGGSRVTLSFPYETELILIVKNLPDARWSPGLKYWHISDSSDVITLLLQAFKGKAYLDYSALNPNLVERIRIKPEEEENKISEKVKRQEGPVLPPLSRTGEADIAKYRRWMESNRYLESTVQKYTSMGVISKIMKKEKTAQQTGQEIINSLKVLLNNGGPKETEYLQLDTDIQTLNGSLHNGELDENFLIEVKSLFSNLLLENTVQGWGFRKPLGYPGDFKMIDYIYTNHHSDEPDFIKWDKYFHYHQAPKAVRNRKEYFKKIICNKINGKQIDLLNVASGPARDLKECYDLLDNKSQLMTNCVEFDIRAIDFAMDLCKDYLNYIEFINKNIIKFNTTKKYDIIWSAGLFDYFNDRTFILILKKFKCLLKPDGEIIVGNFCKSNPSKAYMEIFGEWFLFHRTERELTDLALCAGIEKEDISVDREPLGINLFLRIKKKFY